MLDDAAIERYARQIIVPGIGAAGQEKLLRSTVLVIGHPRGCATASLYLRAAGVNVLDAGQAASQTAAIDVVVLCGVNSPIAAPAKRTDVPICWYSIREDGFRSAVHPATPVPAPTSAASESQPIHDAAACAAAAQACAILLGLEGSDAVADVG